MRDVQSASVKSAVSQHVALSLAILILIGSGGGTDGAAATGTTWR